MVTVLDEAPVQKDINMKLISHILPLFTFFAITFAENEDVKQPLIEDLEAVETVELLKEGVDLKRSASAHSYVPHNTWNPPQNTWNPPQDTWNPPQTTWNPPPTTWNPPQTTWKPPQNTWNPPHDVKPIQPPHTHVPVTVPPQHDYVTYPPVQTYPTWSDHKPTITTPVSVIKNEQWFGADGSYKYEYKLTDGTWVGEEGYFTDPKHTPESLVKKGWYSFKAADGKVYTVTYWADWTGYHASGDHLPKSHSSAHAYEAAPVNHEDHHDHHIVYSDTYNNQPTHPTNTYPTTQHPHYPSHHHAYPEHTYHQK